MDKLISVIIPTYNRKTLTDEAISSVISINSNLIEIIVVDDFSEPKYDYEVINQCGISVRVIRLNKNVGPGMARKIGCENASSKFIAFLDSDDRYDKSWLDYVLTYVIADFEKLSKKVYIVGLCKGGKSVNKVVGNLLLKIPSNMQLYVARLILIIFNPFYTPSIILSKDLCLFKDGLRYCEDYYLSAFAIFKADTVIFPNKISCNLGRTPNSKGGESFSSYNMLINELKVRLYFIFDKTPIYVKLLSPFGIIYQILRIVLKKI